MPNCPHCNAEVEAGQKNCAWCGEEVSASPKPKAPAANSPQQPPHAPPMEPSKPSTAHATRGPSSGDARELAKRGDLDGALRLYREILELDPKDGEALFGTGGIHFKRGEHKKAIEVWLKLKVLNPSYPNLDNWIAKAQKSISPSSLSTKPPAPTSPPPIPTASSPPPAPPPRSVSSQISQQEEEEEDWQRQSVRVEKIDDQVLNEPPPTRQKEEPEPLEENEAVEGAPPDWISKAGWGLALLYIILIWGLYFF